MECRPQSRYHRSMTKTPKRPRDPNQLAKFVIDAATSEAGQTADTPKSLFGNSWI